MNLLFGKTNPSGKLTTTFPYASGQCPIYYDHIPTGRPGGKSKFTSKYLDTPLDPLYPFGYGLSYTSYEYNNVTLEAAGDQVMASVKIRNVGDRAGEEIAQRYLTAPISKRVRPVKKLIAFTKVHLEAGEEKEVIFSIAKDQLGYYDPKMEFNIESGEYAFSIGKDSKECITGKIKL